MERSCSIVKFTYKHKDKSGLVSILSTTRLALFFVDMQMSSITRFAAFACDRSVKGVLSTILQPAILCYSLRLLNATGVPTHHFAGTIVGDSRGLR